LFIRVPYKHFDDLSNMCLKINGGMPNKQGTELEEVIASDKRKM